MRLYSYTRELEDLILFSALRNVKKGFYIDVGANDPTAVNVTKFFYERGWRGINIEPQLAITKILEEDRPEDINLCVGIGKECGRLQMYGTGELATFSKEVADKDNHEKTYEVDILTLTDIINSLPPSHRVSEIHFCKIDVEGFEKEVLEGISDWETFRPWIYVMESTEPQTDIPCHEKWEYILLEHGYNLAFKFGVNRYYLDKRKLHLQTFFNDTGNFLKQHEIIKLNMQLITIN